jgi:hypothetical protein
MQQQQLLHPTLMMLNPYGQNQTKDSEPVVRLAASLKILLHFNFFRTDLAFRYTTGFASCSLFLKHLQLLLIQKHQDVCFSSLPFACFPVLLCSSSLLLEWPA